MIDAGMVAQQKSERKNESLQEAQWPSNRTGQRHFQIQSPEEGSFADSQPMYDQSAHVHPGQIASRQSSLHQIISPKSNQNYYSEEQETSWDRSPQRQTSDQKHILAQRDQLFLLH